MLSKTHSDEVRFFEDYIKILQIFIPSKDAGQDLAKKEVYFLAHCCRFTWLGYDITDHDLLCDYMLEVGVFSERNLVSQYKTKIAGKKWIRIEKKNVKFPKSLIFKKGQKLSYELSLKLNFKRDGDSGGANFTA
jgi:hypothetical protein